jgi:3'-5' exonuclease
VDAVGAPHVGERTEKQLITAFCRKIAELNPQLVTFNGNSFDLPVLRYRAMVHGVSAPGLSVRPYFTRYTADAIDLCDVFSSFSPQGKATLPRSAGSWACLESLKGSMAARSSATSERARSRRLQSCETDVVGTYQLWLRYELFRGMLSQDAFEASPAGEDGSPMPRNSGSDEQIFGAE